MAAFAVIEHGIVANTVELESLEAGREVFGKKIKLVPIGAGDVATIGAGWDGQQFSLPQPPALSLDQARARQQAAIRAACANAIAAGFESAALGNKKFHTYPSGQTDQANLSANVLASLMPGLPNNWTTLQMCCDGKGVWALRPHDASQIQQVGADGNAAIQAHQARHAELQARIAAAETVEAVQAVVWQ
jgi:hypothetical protein